MVAPSPHTNVKTTTRHMKQTIIYHRNLIIHNVFIERFDHTHRVRFCLLASHLCVKILYLNTHRIV